MNRQFNIILALLLFLVVLVLVFFDIVMGSVSIPFRDVIDILLGRSVNTGWEYIILQLRLPRAVAALLAGAGLSVAGLMMQTFFRNPLAGPYVLGISSGAGLGVAVYVMLFGIFGASTGGVLYSTGFFGQAASAVLGAVLVLLLVVAVVPRVKDSVSLLIVGIMFGSIATAIISLLQYFSTPNLVQRFAIWTMGSLGDVSWKQLPVMAVVVLLGSLLAIILIKPMNALLLGENNAITTGVNIKRTRYLIILSSGMIAGGLTAFVGPVAFIGIAVPHVVRMLFNTSNHRVTLPLSAVLGATLLLICDIISQVPGKSILLPINVLTALFGAPVVIWIIVGRNNLKSSF